ncbi:uncharacterized protein A4U43_C01F11730 [Asparagus officinalis]|uniref:Uncharacterized protein n=1 Tax=Asparagus officinalis TaxID=4686 RepID=A0A5P1FT67_ASPOF|nr:uncharacterized protein A4U43_C01F11730 [Asparagus officinalis]
MISQFFSAIINAFPQSSSTLHRIVRSSKFLGIGQLFSELGLASSVPIDPVSISSGHQVEKLPPFILFGYHSHFNCLMYAAMDLLHAHCINISYIRRRGSNLYILGRAYMVIEMFK